MRSLRSLTDLVRAEIERWDGVSVVERAVFGTPDPAEIAAMVDDLCGRALGAGIVGGLCYGTSVGCVAGVELGDGRHVVVKAYQPRWSAGFLAAVAEAQAVAAAGGFPCPMPVAGPVEVGLGLGFANIETYLPDPGQPPIVPEMLPVSAAGLAEVARALRGVDGRGLAGHPMTLPSEGLYPTPHSPVFDFEATQDGVEWIDEIAAAARAARDADPSPPVVMHGDWSARNVRLGRCRVMAAFDWDSLLWRPESEAVGIAAATWSALGVTGDPVAPSADEVRRYVDAYEAARGEPLLPEQRRAAHGSALYGLAYTARCEHALDRGGEVHMRARARLRMEGTTLL